MNSLQGGSAGTSSGEASCKRDDSWSELESAAGSWPQRNMSFTGNNVTYCPRLEPTMPVINCHLYKFCLPKCDLICGWFRVQRKYRGIALRMNTSCRPTLRSLWTFPFGNINCLLSSPGPKPASWPLQWHFPSVRPGLEMTLWDALDSFHQQSSFSSISTICGPSLRVPDQRGPPKAALLVFLQHGLDHILLAREPEKVSCFPQLPTFLICLARSFPT